MNNLVSKLKTLKDITSGSRERRVTSRYSYIDPQLVIALSEEGSRMPDIAGIYGCSYQTLKYQMRIRQPGFDARKYHKWRKKEISVEKAAMLYEKLKSSTKIAKLLHVDTHVITDRLKAAGLKLRSLRREDITAENVAELYEKYKSTTKVAELLDTSSNLIRSRLMEKGIEVKRKRKADADYVIERKRTDIPQKQLFMLYDRGWSIARLARKYDASHGAIRSRITDSGREIREHPGCSREDITPEKAAYWYRKLKRVSRVSEKLKTYNALIRGRLREAGVRIDQSFRNERRRKDIPIKAVVKLKNAGESILSIAQKYKTKRETIRRMLAKYEKGEWT